MLRRALLRTAAAFLLTALIPAVALAQVTAIKAGKLVDPETGTTAADQIILVEGTRIQAVGAGLAIPAGATVIDLSQATVLPGLFDCHTHLCITTPKPGGTSPRDFWATLLITTLSNTTGYRAIQGVANARSMLEAGFTTLRDVGNAANYADTDLRRALEEGLVPGPTLINAGRIIAPYGGQFPSRPPAWIRDLLKLDGGQFIGVLTPEKRDLGNPEYLYADTRDELKKAIRENILYGARVIKIVVDDQPYIYSVEDIRFIVDEAAKAGLKVAAHCVSDAGARHAAEAGVASIEHGFAMTDETLQLARKNKVVLVGTDFPEAALDELGVPRELYTKVIDRLQRAHKIGVMMAFGTDVFFAPPGYTRGSLAVS